MHLFADPVTFAAVLSIPNIVYDVRRLNVHTSDSYVEVNSTSAAFFKEDTWVGGTGVSANSE